MQSLPPAFQLSGRLDITEPIPGVDDATRFHEGWEARIFGLFRTAAANGLFTTDEFRHAIEQMPEYGEMTYFERWIHAIREVCVQRGHIPPDVGGRPAGHVHAHPLLEAPSAEQRFKIGARVVLHDGPGDHHRMPVWARGCTGVILAVRGHFPMPDLIVNHGSTVAYALYGVEIPATEAFPDAHPQDVLALDVYDPYLGAA